MDSLNGIIKEATIERKDEELEEIVDECINITKEAEMPISNDELLETLLQFKRSLNDNRSEVLTNRDISMRSESKILEVAAQNNKIIKSVDTKFNKVIAALFVVFYLLGVVTGMMDEAWKPYLADLLSIAKTSSNIIR